MGSWLYDAALALAGGLSRREALRMIMVGLATALASATGPGQDALARKNKGRGTTCPAGQTACPAGPAPEKKGKGGSPTVCTNLNSDPNNCGACGKTCPSGQSCQGGVCTSSTTCPSGQKLCGTACQQCCTNADCSAGATCNNGTCVGGTCPIQFSGPVREAVPAAPGDPPLTAVGTTLSTFNGQQLKLEIATTDDRNGGLTTRAIFGLGGVIQLEADTRRVGGTTETTVDYGPTFSGIDKAVCTFDGSLIRCVVDGRRTLPFPPGTDPSKIQFEDGKPAPTLTGDPALAQALNALANQAKQSTAGCIAASRPGGPPAPAARLDACNACEKECGKTAWICTAAAMASCFGISLATFGIGAVTCSAGQLCNLNGIRCLEDCTKEGSACCPLKCAATGVCCEKEDRCVGVDPNVALTETCCTPGRELCRNGTLCCPTGQVCKGDVCCPPDGVPCRGRCCAANQVCTSDGTCCPPGTVGCKGSCCGLGEVCTPDGFCCPTGSPGICGFNEFADGRAEPICCSAGQACREVSPGVRVCCGVNSTICGGICCESTAPCLNGSCCAPPNRPCGGVCCTGFTTCCNGKCCAVGQQCVGGNTCCDAANVCGTTCCTTTCCNGKCCLRGQGCSNGSCTGCPAEFGLKACPGLPGQPACCPSGAACCSNGTCCFSGVCCPAMPSGCCPQGQECCGTFCAANCIK